MRILYEQFERAERWSRPVRRAPGWVLLTATAVATVVMVVPIIAIVLAAVLTFTVVFVVLGAIAWLLGAIRRLWDGMTGRTTDNPSPDDPVRDNVRVRPPRE